MNKHPSRSLLNHPTWGAIEIATAYLLIGGLWILFSDQVAARIALSEQMLTIIGLYKGWGYVLITALLLYLLIQRHTAALRASEEKLRRVIDAMPIFISYVDTDRRYQFTNQMYKEWFDDQSEGKYMEDVLGKAAYQTVSKYIDKVLSGETTSFETELPDQDEELFITATYIPDKTLDGRVKGFFVMAQDRTTQRRAEEEHRLWADAFEGCAHGIAISDPNTNRIVVCNPAFASLHKSRVEDIVGSAILSLYATLDHERVRRNVEKADQIGHVSYEARMVRRDGASFPVQTDIVSVLGEDGELSHRVVTAQDISERKQAEENLRKNEERYRNLFENNPHPMWTYDRKTLAFLDVNEAAIQKYGYSRSEFLGMTIADIRPAEDVERLMEYLGQDRPALQHSGGWRHRLKDGRVIDVEITSHIIEIEGYEAALVVAQEVTERKQAEEKLKESEAKYRTLVEHLPAITYISEPDEYVGVSYISPQIKTLGFDRNTWLADPELWFRHIHPHDQARVTSELQQFQTGAESFKAEYRLMLPSGESRWFHDESIRVKDQSGKTLLKQGFMLDITERKQAEEVIHESEERYRLVSELTSDYAYKDRVEANGRIVPEWITDSFTRITGYSLEETHAPDFWQHLVHPDHLQLLLEHIQIVLSGQPDTKEFRIITKNGNIRWLRDFSNPLWDDDRQRVVGLYGAVQDITEHKEAEEKILLQAHWLQQINDALITSDRNFVITGWNPAAERVYGWKAEEVIGKTGEEVLRSEFFHKTREEVIRELRETGQFSAEITQLRKDGSRIDVETRTVTLRDENGEAIGHVSVNRDITDRKQAEAENTSLARFPEENPNPVMRATHEGKLIYANSASQPLLNDWGVKVGDYLPADWISLIEELIVTGSGKMIDVYCGATTYSIMIVYALNARDVNIYGRDITERKQVEEALRRSEALLLQTSEMAKVGGWELNLETMTLIWSREVYRIYEIDVFDQPNLEEAINYYTTEARPIVRAAVQQAIEDGQPFSFDLPMVTAKGRRIWVRAMGQAESKDDKPVRLFGTLQDITERKQAEEYLRRFELLSQHSRDIILFIRREDAQIIEANAAAMLAYGYSREELLSFTIRDLRANDTVSLTKDQMAQADAGGILFETVHRRKDGTTFPVEVSSQGANIGGVRTLISIVRDITERKNVQEALRLKDQLLHLTSEMAKVGGWEFDAATGKGTWTDEVAKIHDLDPAQATNVEIGFSFYTGESREKIEQAVKEAIEFGKPYDLELEMISAKGNRKWVRTMALPIAQNDKVVKVQGIFQDITGRKQIEKALQTAHDELELKVQERTAALSEANALLNALMDTMPDHIYFKDLQSRFVRTSRSQATLLGLSDPAEAIGKTDFDFFPHAARSFAEEQEVMKTGKPLIDLEEWVVWPDGRETWVSTNKMPLRNAEGQTIGIFGISHNITERKRAEQEIKQLNADLKKQAEQLQAANKELEAFSYSVSHDLRAPLRAIDGYTRILLEDYESLLDEEGKRICGIISREARRMGQLIDDLLAFSRLGRKEMYASKIDMRGMAVSVLNELLKEEERARLDVQVGKLPPARGDSSLIRQVWFNLLANAIKFTSKKERGVIEIGSKTTKDEVIYYVRDTGAGFDMEYANKLFGVFQRLHSENEFQGTGVGLAIVQRIVHRHSGRVWAEGEVGKGATFFFALPRKENHHE